MKEVNLETLMGDSTDEDARKTVESWLAGGFDVVRFQNVTMDSSALGQTTYLKVGPGCTYERVEDIKPMTHLYDLPSQRQYPRDYVRHEEPTS